VFSAADLMAFVRVNVRKTLGFILFDGAVESEECAFFKAGSSSEG